MMADAFDNLEKLLQTIDDYFYESEKYETIISMCQYFVNFFKFGFKKTLSFSSTCSDHCVTYALSNEKLCNHDHVRDCADCNSLDFFLAT